MDGIDLINICGASIFLIGAIALLFSAPMLYFKRPLEVSGVSSLGDRFHWRIWPATVANAIFTRLFGPRGAGLRGLLTWRSLVMTFSLSAFANLICVAFILTSVPDDAPEFDLEPIGILTFSHVVFLGFNFLGDLVSVSITRHVLDRMVTLKRRYTLYILLDIGGIILGYLVNFLPGLIALAYASQTNVSLNQLIHAGLFGNVLIPFFLVIFATTSMPWPFAAFALIAVLSITIPTVTYLFFTLLINACHWLYEGVVMRQTQWASMLLQRIQLTGKILMIVGPALSAVSVLMEFWDTLSR